MSSLRDLPLRPELVGEEPYGAPQLDVPVLLNVNENPYPPSPAVIDDMADAVREVAGTLDRYPDREAGDLRGDLANYLGFGLTAADVWAANGSNEVMTHLLGAFGGPGRTLMTFTPSYSMYPEYARNTHTHYVTIPRRADFTLDADLINAAIEAHHPDVVVIASPNNPTGTLTPTSVIAEVCASHPEVVMVVDEAYQEFADNPGDSALALLPTCPLLVVSRTMSKAFAFAGGRLGYLAASPAIVDACRIVRLPYHLSGPTQALARVALRHAPEMLARIDELRESGRALRAWLAGLGLEVVPSSANFCLFGRFVDRHAVWQGLLDRGVLIREVGPEGYLRVSYGTPAELAVFRAALEQVLPGHQLMDETRQDQRHDEGKVD